eukprot:CAMPEP_0197079086 /NCGR_PEP_ID=MMETSP1384-20130603/213446_1 /TAXON_ID=29189 /ORGANISM="Ammonia sp." /LENGTH=295 /DNA_ID=CAMNT_0042517959 /DNA_START=891 /DNA_END=1778 /DNA_ORIENTATION=-
MSAFVRSCICVIIAILLYIHDCNADTNCMFADSGKSGLMLDLSSLDAIELHQADEDTPPHDYQYSPCRNALKCGQDTAMALRELQDETECIVMANWDNYGTLPSYEKGFERWTFNYSTGNDCNGKPFVFLAYFSCDSAAGDYRILNAGSIGDCMGFMSIDSKWACPGAIHTTPLPEEVHSLSGGTIFLIVLAIGFLLYFVVGYVICAIINRRDHSFGDYESNIPHIVFWMRLPALVVAGCAFCRDFCLALCCENALVSADKTDHLVEEKRDDNVNVTVDNPFVPPSVDDEDDFDE